MNARSNSSVPVFVPSMPRTKSIVKYLNEIDKNKIYTNFGPLTNLLRQRFSQILGIPAEFITTSANATQALTGSVLTLDSNYKNAETLLCPSWTFAATPSAILNAKKKLRFVDVEEDTWQSSIPERANDLGIHVLPFGDNFSVHPNFDKRNLPPLIIDGAASFANIEKVTFPKNRIWIFIVSMHATKLLGAGEGAIVISNDKNWIQRFNQWSNFGFWGRRESDILGTNAKLNEYNAAVALASLDHFAIIRDEYEELSKICIRISKQFDLKVCPTMNKQLISPYWIIRVSNSGQRSSIIRNFEKQNIDTRLWWSQGSHRMKAFRSQKVDNLNNTNKIAETYLGLPFHLELSDENLSRIETTLEISLTE